MSQAALKESNASGFLKEICMQRKSLYHFRFLLKLAYPMANTVCLAPIEI